MARRSLLLLALLVGSLLRIVYAQWPTQGYADGITLPLATIRLEYNVTVPSGEYHNVLLNVTLPPSIQEQLKQICDTYDRAMVERYGTYRACRAIYVFRLFFVESNTWRVPTMDYYMEYREDGIPIRYYFIVPRSLFPYPGTTHRFYIYLANPGLYSGETFFYLDKQGFVHYIERAGTIGRDYMLHIVGARTIFCFNISKKLDYRFPILVGITASGYDAAANLVFDLRNSTTGEFIRIILYRFGLEGYFTSGLRPDQYIVQDIGNRLIDIRGVVPIDLPRRYDVLDRVCIGINSAWWSGITVQHMFALYRLRD